MSSRQKMTFDLTRLENVEQSCQGLHTAQDRARFTFIVADYMDFLRSEPWQRQDWDDEAQMKAALNFVLAVNNDRGWPHARQAVPEFQSPAGDVSHLQDPMLYIMTAVRPRLLPPPLEIPSAQKAEEGLVWLAIRQQVKWIANLGGFEHNADEARKAEVEEVIGVLGQCRERVARNQEEKRSKAGGGGEDQDADEQPVVAESSEGGRVARTDQRPRKIVTNAKRRGKDGP